MNILDKIPNINIHFGQIRESVIIYLLCAFPFYCYFLLNSLGEDPYPSFTYLAIIFSIHLILERIKEGKTIYFPFYLKALAVFASYEIISSYFLTDEMESRGLLKIFLKNEFFGAFVSFFLVENIKFSSAIIKRATYLLIILVFISTAVIVYQVPNPLFFLNIRRLLIDSNLPTVELLLRTAAENPGDLGHNAAVVLVEGYRFSIYSWCSNNSIGIDFIAIYVCLFALVHLSNKMKAILAGMAGILSFLCSSRYVMLNFVITSAYSFFVTGRVLILFRYLLALTAILVGLYFAAPLFGVDVDEFITDRLLDDSASTRLYAFEMFGKVFPKRPIFGTGGINTNDMLTLAHGITSHIHVGWLSLFYWYGIIGGSLWCIFYFSLLHELRQRALKTQYWGAFFGVLVIGLTNLTGPAVNVYAFGLVICLIYSRHGHLIFKEPAENK